MRGLLESRWSARFHRTKNLFVEVFGVRSALSWNQIWYTFRLAVASLPCKSASLRQRPPSRLGDLHPRPRYSALAPLCHLRHSPRPESPGRGRACARRACDGNRRAHGCRREVEYREREHARVYPNARSDAAAPSKTNARVSLRWCHLLWTCSSPSWRRGSRARVSFVPFDHQPVALAAAVAALAGGVGWRALKHQTSANTACITRSNSISTCSGNATSLRRTARSSASSAAVSRVFSL